jgi:hypothetical protein
MSEPKNEYHPWGEPIKKDDLMDAMGRVYDTQREVVSNLFQQREAERLEIFKKRCAARKIDIDFDQPAEVWAPRFQSHREGNETSVFYEGRHVITFIDEEEISFETEKGFSVNYGFKFF